MQGSKTYEPLSHQLTKTEAHAANGASACSDTYFCGYTSAHRQSSVHDKLTHASSSMRAHYTSGSETDGGSGPELRFQRLAVSFLPRAG